MRSWRAPDNTRLVFDLSAPVTWQISPDSTPARLIVDIEGARPAGPLALPSVQSPLKGLRLDATAKGQRLVIDTSLELLPRIFQLAPNEKYGHRLVLDLYEKPAPKSVATDKSASAVTGSAAVASAPGAVARPVAESAKGAAESAAHSPATANIGGDKGGATAAPAGVTTAPTIPSPVVVAPAAPVPEAAGEKSDKTEKVEKSSRIMAWSKFLRALSLLIWSVIGFIILGYGGYYFFLKDTGTHGRAPTSQTRPREARAARRR